MANRVQAAADKIAAKMDDLDMGARLDLDTAMALDFSDHFAFQEQQARAHVEQLLTTEEAQTVYMALGEVGSTHNGGWAEGTTTPMKVAVTQLIGELLARRIAAQQLGRAAA